MMIMMIDMRERSGEEEEEEDGREKAGKPLVRGSVSFGPFRPALTDLLLP